MKDYKDEMLSDAIKTALDYSYELIKMRRAIFVMCFAIIALIAGYFI